MLNYTHEAPVKWGTHKQGLLKNKRRLKKRNWSFQKRRYYINQKYIIVRHTQSKINGIFFTYLDWWHQIIPSQRWKFPRKTKCPWRRMVSCLWYIQFYSWYEFLIM